MTHIVLLARGAGGDVNPFVAIGNGLRLRGHHVTLLSHCYYAQAAAQAGLDFEALDTPEEFEQMVADAPLAKTPPGYLQLFQRHVLPRLLPEYQQLLAHCQSHDTLLISRHNPFAEIVARVVAEKLNLPFVAVFIAPNEMATMPTTLSLVGPVVGAEINRFRNEVGLSPVTDWAAWVNSPRRGIAPWPDWFAPPHSHWPPGVTPVGFLASRGAISSEIPPKVQAMLESSPPPILIGSGLGPFMSPEYYRAAVEACRVLGHPGLLVTQHASLVPQNLPKEVAWFKYLPFAEVMPRSAAVIHHGGIGTLGQAFAAGIPQVAMAAGADRPYNAMCLEQTGVGLFLPPPRWQPEAIAAALRQLMASAEVQKRCQELAQRIHASDSTALASEVVESLLTGELAPAGSTPAPTSVSQSRDVPNRLSQLSPEKRALLELRLKEIAQATQPASSKK